MKITHTNLSALAGLFGGTTDWISNRVDSVHFSHINRCIKAGLVEVDVPGKRMRLTAAGTAALEERTARLASA